jgi:hypothetical protein
MKNSLKKFPILKMKRIISLGNSKEKLPYLTIKLHMQNIKEIKLKKN